MKVAIVGSRGLNVDISKYIPSGVTTIISGGAKGIDTLAEQYADRNNLKKLFLNPNTIYIKKPHHLRETF